ncbi:hypothetical protein SteCoe_2510 [Stentor coeruleus]|uniref:GDT1 family protein n=1 Tax=Stentor coeruleus TaxID=5963 RepID=A0A1R2CZ86_9CILI|nr:hypothetical protein SteCoe_2510 [Stentor coeruleus]
MESFLKGAGSSFLAIFISEIGDRTFIILAILAQKQSLSAIVLGNQIALTPLIIISAYLGNAVTLLPTFYLNLIATLAFLVFSFVSFYEAYKESSKNNDSDSSDSENEQEKLEPLLLQAGWWKVLIKTTLLIFMAELGDVSQFATLSLSMLFSPEAVIIGASLAMLLCGLLAVGLGRVIGKYVNEMWTNLFTGCLFLGFGIYSFAVMISE